MFVTLAMAVEAYDAMVSITEHGTVRIQGTMVTHLPIVCSDIYSLCPLSLSILCPGRYYLCLVIFVIHSSVIRGRVQASYYGMFSYNGAMVFEHSYTMVATFKSRNTGPDHEYK